MAIFTFDAPAQFDSDAPPLARKKHVACWLRDRLAARGVIAFGPLADASGGWRLAVHAEDGFVSILLGRRSGARRFTVYVDKLGEADAEYEDTVAAIEDALGVGVLECDLAG